MKVRELENRLQQFDRETGTVPMPDPALLLSLAQDLPEVWDSSSTEMQLKQRIVCILIREIVADVDDDRHESSQRVKREGLAPFYPVAFGCLLDRR